METTSETNGLDVIQSMIDISADRLEGLRTQCATSASLTQQEIRSLETKLVRMFSELLLTKGRLPERIPSNGLAASGAELRQWLRVVGLSQESLNVCLQRLNTLEELLEKSDTELKNLLVNNANLRDEEIRRLVCAMQSLKTCRSALQDGVKEPENLFWDSWDRHHHHHRNVGNVNNVGTVSSPRSHRTMAKPPHKTRMSPVTGSGEHIVQSPTSTTTPEEGNQSSIHTITPSPSPPNSPCTTTISSSSGNNNTTTSQKLGHRKSGTPPPKKKHQTLLAYHPPPSTPSHVTSSSATSGLAGGGAQAATGTGSCTTIATVTPTSVSTAGSSDDPFAPITKSKSHESQLQDNPASQAALTNNNVHKVQAAFSNLQHQVQHIMHRTRLHTEPTTELPSHIQYCTEVIVENTNNLTVPRSPCTLGMGHQISHRFTKVFKVMSTCDLCLKQMFFGLKCKECKYRCHKDCEDKVPPSCGLPPEYVEAFKLSLQSNEVFIANTSPNMGSRPGHVWTARKQKPSAINATADSSSPGSSCNSSSPSSPALFNMSAVHMSHTHHNSSTNPLTTPSSAQKQTIQFNFPEVPNTAVVTQSHVALQQQQLHQKHSGITLETHPLSNISVSSSNCTSVSVNTTLANSGTGQPTVSTKIQKLSTSSNTIRPPLSELADTHRSNDSDKTGSTSASTDSDRTPVRLDSTEEGDSGNWPRQNSLSLKEWDIPYDDLHLLEKIGKGRFGTVHRALWHGDVAVKLLKEDYLDDERNIEAFKLEVATFKKTRHENLVLFMGACMNPPFLAIVTSLCKGNTLYTYIHIRRDKFNLNRTTLVAQQISQGMGYLHARGIFHKDLRTKNIFLENGKVIITDFGLFSSTKLFYCDLGLLIPDGWLCYLAPELMRSLTPYRPTDEVLPFSRASDVYSFGTVWYELLCGEFPFKLQPAEAIIWQVGRGMKQTLANLQTSRDVKDILMLCWSFQADDRPDFAKLLTLLEKLPKKRLARSPSHPVQLSRSAESVF